MITIGLTGSIGMGKTALAEIFATHGAAIHNADDEVHHLIARGAINEAFPQDQYPQIYDGASIDRKALGQLVFSDDLLRKKLETTLHPLVLVAQQKFIEQQKQSGTKLVVLDVPLLFETGSDKIVDVTIVASAPPDIQRTRVLARPNMTEEKFTAILNTQMSDPDKRERADYVVNTGTNIESTRKEVENIIKLLSQN
ncbi:dephospho-CoA kinase [Alphaproteobacteria bacterium]|nr:dephospho-CoA kinase [Alphaproteobacteria bacterium]